MLFDYYGAATWLLGHPLHVPPVPASQFAVVAGRWIGWPGARAAVSPRAARAHPTYATRYEL
jgi:hypothetical protein